MQDIKSDCFSLHILEEKDIDECAELIGNSYANFSAFTYHLKYKPTELKEGAKKLLSRIVEDKLSVVAKDSNGKIIGSYAGVKLSKINSLRSNSFKKREELNFDVNLEKMQYHAKALILEELEYIFLKQNLLINKDEEFAVLGKYYSVSVEYFGTSLAKDLALYYNKNLLDREMRHCYGIIFSIKVFNIFTKNYPVTILNEYKVTLVHQKKKVEFDVFLISGDAVRGKIFFSKF